MPEAPRIDPQIKSRQRVRDLAEVYTHEREVNAMLDLVPDMFPSIEDPENVDRSFLEPACGSGNFLVEILRRKLAFITKHRYGSAERVEDRMLRALSSIYGIDISVDNVLESRDRMRAIVEEIADAELGAGSGSQGFAEAVEVILTTNVIQADTLAEADEIELIEYASQGDGTFIREWTKPLSAGKTDLTLFFTDPPRDERPVHYSEFARQTTPATADSYDQRAA
ncbi:MAG: hypothetical protein R2700_10740 [Solirubrobacterales bacterium]